MARRRRGARPAAWAVAAALAMAVLAASTAARCALGGRAGEGGRAPEAPAAAEADAGTAEEAGDAPGWEEALALAESREWAAAGDATKRLTLSSGRITESDGESATTSEYAATGGSGGRVDLTLTRQDGSTHQATLEVGGEGDGARLRCEQLTLSFDWVPAPEAGRTAVTGLDDAYLAMVGGDREGLEDAVSEWCSAHAPGATEAAFAGEVFVDTRTGSVTTALTCDDPGQTIASVTWSGGEFEVEG